MMRGFARTPFATAAILIGVLGWARHASAAVAVTLYGVTDGNTLIRFNSGDPGTIHNSVTITGLQPGETIVGIDEQPDTSQLFAVGSSSRIYTIDAPSGVATQVGSGPFSPALNGSFFGVTFNPDTSFNPRSYSLRVVSDAGQNLVLDTRSGLAITNSQLPPGSHVVASTSLRVDLGEASDERVYGIDSTSDQLVVIAGLPVMGGPTVGSLGVVTSDVAAMTASGVEGPAWAALQVGGLSRLYTIDLSTGATTLIGTIGTGAPVHGLTIAQPGQAQPTALGYVVRESSGTLTVPLVRTGSTVGQLLARCETTNIAGGATPGVDFTPTSQTVLFPDGVSTATCSIPILHNPLAAPVEEFSLSLPNVLPGFVWILDDDGPNPLPSIAITSPTTSSTFTAHSLFITLAGTASAGVVSVKWSNGFQSGTAVGTTNWTAANIPLRSGLNGLSVQATDASGAVNIAVLTLTVPDLQYALAEGSTGGFFNTDILLANPYLGSSLPISVTWLKEDGTTITQVMTLPQTSRTTIPVASIPGLESTAMSTFVTSLASVPIAVERTMRWDRTGYGAHGEKASAGTALTWYFAEGSQGFFNTYLLLANPGPTPNQATVEFLFEDGTTVTKTYPLKPSSRFTLFAGDVPELVNRSFGMTVTFAQPGMAERAMYFRTTPLFKGGFDSAGATDLSTTWYLAEGATGSFFTTFLELANPGTTPGTVTVTYLPASGTPVTKTHIIGAKQRLSFNIAFEDAALTNAAVATQITSTVPIVVERSQYWPYTPDQWYEAHNSGGVTAPGTSWALAEGRVGGPNAYQTYILLANFGMAPAQVTIQFLREPGRNPQTVSKMFSVSAMSRFNVAVPGDVPELADETFGAYITSFVPIVVERAMYSNANGLVWSAGTNATATRLP